MLHNETLMNAIPLNITLLNTIPLDAKACNSSTIYIVLFAIFLIISVSVSSVFIYFHWYLKKDNIPVRLNFSTQTTIY